MSILTSPKWTLIKTDFKSWAISTALFLGPIVLVSLLQVLLKQNYGEYTEPAALVLGSLLKLAQKWVQANKYQG